MIDTLIVPKKTVASAKGEGPAMDISAAKNRVFLLTLCITKIIEQEALDVSIYGSADGTTWSAVSLASFPLYCSILLGKKTYDYFARNGMPSAGDADRRRRCLSFMLDSARFRRRF